MTRPLLSVFSVILIFFLVSCITLFPQSDNFQNEEPVAYFPKVTGPDVPQWIWDSLPQGKTLVFIASSYRHSDEEYEEFLMLNNAALQVGVFEEFWGASQDMLDEKVNRSILMGRTRAHYDGEAEDAAMKTLELVETGRNNQEAWGKFQLERPGFPSFNWRPVYKNGAPTWITSPPDIPGWIVGVANGRPQSTMGLSIRKADEVALDEIIRQVHGRQKSEAVFRQEGSENWSQSSGKIVSAGQGFGVIRGFLVVARWFDGSDVWSMAVCPDGWNVPID